MDESILQSLLKPEAYDERPQSVRLKQTHISYIFITDNFVYKIKKPVDFGFLNFTTIDRRLFYCLEEVRLNRRLSPDVYLGVVELRQYIAGASFTGDGAILDYAVKMRRLPEELMLDRLVSAGLVDESTMIRIAVKVAGFHLTTDKNQAMNRFGSLDAIRQNWDDNFRQVSELVGKSVSADDLAVLHDWADRFFSENSALFEQRIEDGFIRDCDGDLHLANICVGEDVWIFDCIEFNNLFRYIDTASDIAFLLMDLDSYGRSDLASVFLDEYIRLTGDCGSLLLVDFYKTYRALVRCKVSSLTLQDSGISQTERTFATETANSYFRLARGYILRKRLSSTMIMIGGMIGSGKSTLARHLGRELGLRVLSSDVIRKELFGSGLIQKENLYAQDADDFTYSELLRRSITFLEKGESVIIDATFRRRSDRERFRAAVPAAVATSLVMTDSSEAIILDRLNARKTDPDKYSDADDATYTIIDPLFEWPDTVTERFISVPTSGSVSVAVDAVLVSLGVI